MKDVDELVGAPDSSVAGRETELAEIRRLGYSGAAGRALVLAGGPGIGKTTLWEAGIRLARDRGIQVLAARPSEAEAQFSFSALSDLLEDVDVAGMESVPAPQRRALDIALLRAEAAGRSPEPRAVASGLLNVLRTLGTAGRLLVAIDDVQWLDRHSADALAFAARRLPPTAAGYLLTERTGTSSAVLRVLEPCGLERLEIGPLEFDAISQILSSRISPSLPRRIVKQIFETAGGHPLFAIELGRTLAGHKPPGIGETIPVPQRVEDLLGKRVQQLPPPVNRILLALAVGGDLRTEQALAVAGAPALDEALDSGVVITTGDRVRPSHPLLAAAALARAKPSEQRTLHAQLALLVDDDTQRARHLALAAVHRDAGLAAVVVAAASGASARGAVHEAVELAQHALRLTPVADPQRSERLLALAGYLETAGERQQVTDLLTPEMATLPPGAPRVRAWLLLSEGGAIGSYHDHSPHYDRALAEAGNDPRLRGLVLATKALSTVAEGVERIGEAQDWALEALEVLPGRPRQTPEVERLALEALGWARSLQGRPIDDVCEQFRRASGAPACILDSPEPVAGLRLTWRGETESARAVLYRFLSLADERGEAVSYAWLRLNAIELELRTGEWESVSRRLDEWADSLGGRLLITPTYQRCRALLAAGRGLADEVERWAGPALADAEVRGYRWQVLEALRARGIAALLKREPERAGEALGQVWEHCRREGVDDLGVFPVAPDLVQALVELGRNGEATAVTGRLREMATQQGHPWGLVTARRCGALTELSERYDDQAAAAIAGAADAYGRLGLRVDQARSWLSLGSAARRCKKWGMARSALERAAGLFEQMESPGWAGQARAELARIPARRPLPAGELTPAERGAAELAADGLSNQQIARRLSVSAHTVEVHLSRAYRKLGIGSRTELASRLRVRG